MLGLKIRIGMGYQRARLAQPEVKVPEKTLTLSHSESESIFLLDKRSQGLSIPYMPSQAEILWASAQGGRNLVELFLAEPSRSARSIFINQASKAFFFKAMNPILNSAR